MSLWKQPPIHAYTALGIEGIQAGVTCYPFHGENPGSAEMIPDMTGERFDCAYLEQVHGANIVEAKSGGLYTGDGLFTSEKGLLLAVRTADCLPLLFLSPDGERVGAVHMGWRSAEAGILDGLGDLTGYKAVAGPGLRKCCFRVGKEFLRKPVLAPFVGLGNDGYYFDPVSFAGEKLISAGMDPGAFRDSGICSFCSDNVFYSYRRGEGFSRNISFIVKTR